MNIMHDKEVTVSGIMIAIKVPKDDGIILK